MMRPQPQPDLRPAMSSGRQRRTPDRHPARSPVPIALPAWDSFPSADRRLLVDLLVQTACRQIRTRPLLPRPGDQG